MAPRRTCCVANLCVVLIASSSKETTRRQMIAKHLFPPAVKLSRSRHKHVANVKQHKRARLARPPSVDTRASEQPFFAQNLVNTKICRKLDTNKKWQRQQKKNVLGISRVLTRLLLAAVDEPRCKMASLYIGGIYRTVYVMGVAVLCNRHRCTYTLAHSVTHDESARWRLTVF